MTYVGVVQSHSFTRNYLSRSQRCSLAIMSTWFYDVPRPIYLVRHALARFELRNNTYKYYTEKLVGPHDEDVSSDDQDDKCKELTTEEQCEEIFSQVKSGNVEVATKVLEALKLKEKEGSGEPEPRSSDSNGISKLSSSEIESTSKQDKPKASTSKQQKPKSKVDKIKQKVGDPEDKEGLSQPKSGDSAEKSIEAPKYVKEAVKKALEMGCEPDFKVGCCNSIPKLSSSEISSKQAGPKLRAKKIQQTFGEPKDDEGKDSKKAQDGPKKANKPVKMESELDTKAGSCNDIPKSSSCENKATSEQARLKLRAKRNFKGQKVKQNCVDPPSDADCGKGATRARECPQNSKEAVQKMKEHVHFIEQEEEVKCTATTCKSPIVVSLPLPAPRTSESTEEILRR